MHSVKRPVAITLLLLMAMVAQGGLANEPPTFENSIAAGRELSFSASVKWHGNPEMDDETNRMIATMLDTMKFSGATFGTRLSGYSRYLLAMNSSVSFGVDTVMNEEGIYTLPSSNIKPFALLHEDSRQLFQNLGAYCEQALGMNNGVRSNVDYAELFDAIGNLREFASSEIDGTQPQWSEKEFEALAERLDLEPIAIVMDEWVQSIAEGEPFKERIDSKLGIKTKKATVYQVTQKKLVILIQKIVPMLQKNEAIWEYIVETANATLPLEKQITLTDEGLDIIKQGLDMVSNEAKAIIPNNTIARYIECFDAEGIHSLNILAFQFDSDEWGQYRLYAEWVPNEATYQVSLRVNNLGADLLVEPMQEEPAELDGLPTIQKTSKATLSILQNGKALGDIEITRALQEAASARKTLLTMVIIENRKKTGFVFDAYERFSQNGLDTAEDCTLDIYSLMNESHPILSLSIAIQTGEPAGMPFDPRDDDIEFIYPGQMSEDAFIRWCSQGMSTGFLQVILKFLSKMPPQIFAKILPSTLSPP